jgi:hypothetical protein
VNFYIVTDTKFHSFYSLYFHIVLHYCQLCSVLIFLVATPKVMTHILIILATLISLVVLVTLVILVTPVTLVILNILATLVILLHRLVLLRYSDLRYFIPFMFLFFSLFQSSCSYPYFRSIALLTHLTFLPPCSFLILLFVNALILFTQLSSF